MRDPMSWAVPVFRAFGIPVKVHILFFVVTLGMFFRETFREGGVVWWLDVFLFAVVALFGIILLHEFGHQFGARSVGGEAKEILIWPLGGLAFNDIPHGWRPLFVTVAAGPAVNVLVCVVCAALLAVGGFLPPLNPLTNPYTAAMHDIRKDRTVTSPYALRVYKPDSNAPEKEVPDVGISYVKTAEYGEALGKRGYERGLAPVWAVWVYRVFWLSWVLFLFNLIPAYPLDGGQLLQSLVWWRTSYRQGVVVSSYSGFGFAVLFLIVSIAANESLFMGLALFMLYSASMKLFALDTEDGPFGYDFSAGYTSLERDDEPARRPKKPGAVARWWQARKARKLQREVQQRQLDEERVDQLLDKIRATGKDSLTDEERRFLERASARYRNRS